MLNTTTNKNRLIVFGSIVQDLVSYVERFPRPGESIHGKKFQTFCGGKGANQAVMASILDSDVYMVGRVGKDIFGDFNINSIKSFGVNVSLVDKKSDKSTGCATISVTDNGENSIIVTLGANHDLNRERAIEIEFEISKAKLIMCQSEIDQLGNLEAFRIAKKYNVTTFFNPAPGLHDLNREIIKLTDILCANENETEFLTGLTLKTLNDFENAAKTILTYGPHIVIITLGSKGALFCQRNKNKNDIFMELVSAPEVNAVDTVGAGDCFCGTFASFFIQNPNGNIVDMVRKATFAASLSVTKIGSQQSYPTYNELCAFNIL